MGAESVAALRADLRARRVSAVELVTESLARIEAAQPRLNAVITVAGERALEAARAADRALKRGEGGDLAGIPVAHKDNLCTEGLKTTCGSRMLAGFVPPYESTATARIQAAGAITVAKTNMDEFAMGSSTEHSHFGAVRNPWDTTRVPGGSSGGSAAAVAAGLVPLATGSDTGGSIRQPAAFCGVTGIKPSYGRVSRWGLVAFASSLDQAGAIGRSAEDCAWLLRAMSGHDPLDSTSLPDPVEDYPALLGQDLTGLRVGLPDPYWQGIDEPVAAAAMIAVEELKRSGVEVREVAMPNAHLAVSTYYILAPAECSSNLSRFDGVRYGHRCADPSDLQDLYFRSRAEGFGAEVRRRILVGTYALSAGYYEAFYGKAMRARRLIADDFSSAFDQVDVLIAPTTPTVAFGLGDKESDPIAMYSADVNTVAVNLAGLPAISVPGPQVSGLPVGVQLIGRYRDEARLLALAHRLQQATDWHQQRPPEPDAKEDGGVA